MTFEAGTPEEDSEFAAAMSEAGNVLITSLFEADVAQGPQGFPDRQREEPA